MLPLAFAGLSDTRAHRLVAIVATVVVVLFLSAVAERWFASQERALERRYRGDFASAKTRFRLLRRAVVVVVVTLGALAALSTIPDTADLARTLLASGAVIAAILGFALRAPLGNVAAGMQLAFTQPFRLGDRVGVGEITGVVEEINLSYTVLRRDDGRRAYLPNEQLIVTPIVNATIEDPTRAETITVPVSADADLVAAQAFLLELADDVPGRVSEPAPSVRVSAITIRAVHLELTAWVADGATAIEVGSALRERAVARLRAEGMLARG